MLKKIIATTVAAGLMVGHSAAATAAPIAADRAASPTGESENLKGMSGLVLVGLFIAIAAAIILLVEENKDDIDDLPASP